MNESIPSTLSSRVRATLALISLSVLCLQCGPPEPTCIVRQIHERQFVVPGAPSQVKVGIELACSEPTARRADQVVVDVLDPDDRPVAFQVTGPIYGVGDRPGTYTESALVSFVPNRQGTWRVAARFEPSFGQTQQAFQAVRSRSDAAATVVPVSFPDGCVQYGVIGTNSPLCAFVPDGGKGAIATASGQQLIGAKFGFNETSIWRVASDTPSRLERWVESGGTLQLTHQAGGPFDDVVAIVPTEPGAVVLTSTQSLEPPVEAHVVVAVPEPDGGLRLDRYSLGVLIAKGITANARRALVSGIGAGGRLVTMVFDGGTASSAPLSMFAPGPVGEDPEGLWLRSIDTIAPFGVAGAVLGDTVWDSFPRLMWPYAPTIPVSTRSPAGVNSEYVFPALEGGGIEFETFDAGSDYFPPTGATHDSVFARSRDGKSLKLIAR